MCFSATASFGASAVLSVITIASFKKAATPAQRMLACIPLFFATQQSIEGMVWLSLMHAPYKHLYTFATYTFLVFAEAIWPVMVPLVALVAEPLPGRRKVLKVLLGTGIAVCLFHLYCLLAYDAHASAQAHHVRYDLYLPPLLNRISIKVYFIPAIIPPFISSLKPLRWLGVFLVASYLISRLFYQPYIISVWCFFATIICIIALIAIRQLARPAIGGIHQPAIPPII